MTADCADGTLTVGWSDGTADAGTIAVALSDASSRSGTIAAGNPTGSQSFAVPDTASGTVTVTFGSASADATFACTVSAGYATTRQTQMLTQRLDNIHTTLGAVDTKLAGVNDWLRGLQGAITAGATDSANRDRQRQAQLARIVVSAYDAERAAQTALNQARHQTHALLALVAVLFAMWLRPILRSRREVS